MIFYGVLLSFFLEYFRPDTYLPIISALKINTFVPIGVFLASFCTPKKNLTNKSILFSTNGRWLVFFLVLIAISIMTSEVTLYAYAKFKTAVGYFFMFFIISKEIESKKKLNLFLTVLISIHLLLMVLNPKVILNPETRSYIKNVTFLGDGNDFALSLCIILPWCLFLFNAFSRKITKYGILFAGALLFLAIVGTQSRGASLAIAGIMLYQLMKSRKKIVGIAILFIIVMVVLMFASQNYLQRMVSIADYKTEESAQGRIMAWKAAGRMALANPLLGQGAGHFAVKYGAEFRPPGIGRTEIPWQTAHSMYFLALGELGVPGLIFLVSILWYNFKQNNRFMKTAAGLPHEKQRQLQQVAITLNSSLIGFAISAAFLSVLYYPHLFVITGLFDAVRRLYLEGVDLKSV